MQSPGWPRPPAPEKPENPGGPLRPLAEGEQPSAPGENPMEESGRYEDFLRSTVDWLWETDAALSLTYVSSSVALKLGLPARELIGRPLSALGQFAGSGREKAQARAAIEARRPFRGVLFVVTGSEQRETAYHLSGVPVFDERNGRFSGYRGTAAAAPAEPAADTTEEELRVLAAELEEALLRQQEVSWQSSRAKGTGAPDQGTLARTAHELRQPLNAVVGYADLALKEVFGPLSERYQDCFRTIREAGRHLDQMVSQMQQGDPEAARKGLAAEVVEVAGVVAKAKAIIALAAKTSDVDLSRVGPMAGGRVIGDRVACTQILVNLLNNAVKFTSAGGAVGVETLAGPEDQLQIVVWDTGIGIPEEEQERIFDPRYRADPGSGAPQARGLGLGLAISRDLARAMDGDITVSSQPEQGSRFMLSLPLSADPAPSWG